MLHTLMITALGKLRQHELLQEAERIRREALFKEPPRGRRGLWRTLARWQRGSREAARQATVTTAREPSP